MVPKKITHIIQNLFHDQYITFPSYVAFCTVLYAPKFCSMSVPVNPPEAEIAEWTPAPSFCNRYLVTKMLNDLVISKNREQGIIPVRLDYIGIKRFKSGTVQHRFDNKPGATPIWREREVFRKLHLTMENKLRVISLISSCFMGNSRQESSN